MESQKRLPFDHLSDQSNCPGCKRSFQQGQTLPPEGIHIEYKNYYLPIKDHQPKWILMKTIIAFLNSKGGTIFMGVDDSTREVIGVSAELKQQDMFMLQFDSLLDYIQPEVDLRHKQQVRVQFVPVLKDKTFQGKYIIKIMVKQGDPSKVYHFAQTLKFYNQDKKHHDQQFKVLWGFYRSNMGKVDSIKGTQLIREVYQKAKRPSIIAQTFHQGCNPPPLQVSVRNLNIGFKNLKDLQLKKKILQFVQKKLKILHLQASYSIEQKSDDDTVILKFKSITQYKQADAYILQHQRQLSEMISGQDSLLDEGYIDNTHFYKIGQSYNPSLRYLRNRSRSRNRSIQIPENKLKQYGQKKNQEPFSAKVQHQTRFKPRQPEIKQQSKSAVTKPALKNQFIKVMAKNQQQYQENDQQGQDQQDNQLSPQQKEQSPYKNKKKFQLKSQQFPQLGKQQSNTSATSENRNASIKNKSKEPQQAPKINVYPPQAKNIRLMKQQSQVKQINNIKQTNKQQKQFYHVSIGNIYQKSFGKVIHYLDHSLGGKLDKIPHKLEEVPSNQEVILHFASLKDIESFIQELSTSKHHKSVLNGFGEGRVIQITVKKGGKLEDFKWLDNQNDKQIQLDNRIKPQSVKQTSIKLEKQSIKKQQQKDIDYKSPKKNQSPAKSFIQKAKLKVEDIRGCPFVISNIRTDMDDLQRKHLVQLLNQIFKHFCSQNAKVQIANQSRLRGVIQLIFQSDQERKHFADLMQSQIIKYHEFTDFFKGHRAYWGVPTGNIIIHHYKSQDKVPFKQQIQKLFSDNKQTRFITSKYIKDKDGKYYLNLNFHPNTIIRGVQILYQNIQRSPLKDFATSKQGIVVTPQINRI